MADSFDRYDEETHGNGFMMGLLTGAVLGAGIGMLLAPKAGGELRGALGERARNLGSLASEQYKRASETASGWADRGRDMVDRARETVQRGAEEARGYAGATTGSDYSSGQGGTYGTGTSSTTYGTGTGTGTGTGGSFGATGGTDYGRS